jgi:tetratricopeptide (TPR) repeat protein
VPRNRYLAWVCCLLLAAGCQPEDKTKVTTAGRDGAQPSSDDAQVRTAPTPRILPETYLASGRMLEQRNDVRAAITQYERAIAANPKFVAAYNQLGMLYQKIGRLAEAEHIFKQGLKADPAAATLRNNLGYCYLTQQRYTDAEKEFRNALELNPVFKRARMNLAIVLANTGREEESFLQFREVVPDDVARYNLAVIALSRRDYAGAEKALRQALAVNPQCAGAREQLERVQAVVRGEQAGPKEPTDWLGSIRQMNGASPSPEKPTGTVPLAGTADPEGQKTP